MTGRIGGGFNAGIPSNFQAPAHAETRTVGPDPLVHIPNAEGNTPLIQALLVPTPNAVDLETIKRYFDQGAMVSAIVGSGEYAGCNALTLAIKRQLPLDIVLLIVDKARTEQIATAKGEVVPFFDHPDQNGPMPFDEATARDHKTVVQTLVLDCGVPLSAKAFGIVLDARHFDVCKLLINLGTPMDGSHAEKVIATGDDELLTMWVTAAKESAIFTPLLESGRRDMCQHLIKIEPCEEDIGAVMRTYDEALFGLLCRNLTDPRKREAAVRFAIRCRGTSKIDRLIAACGTACLQDAMISAIHKCDFITGRWLVAHRLDDVQLGKVLHGFLSRPAPSARSLLEAIDLAIDHSERELARQLLDRFIKNVAKEDIKNVAKEDIVLALHSAIELEAHEVVKRMVELGLIDLRAEFTDAIHYKSPRVFKYLLAEFQSQLDLQEAEEYVVRFGSPKMQALFSAFLQCPLADF